MGNSRTSSDCGWMVGQMGKARGLHKEMLYSIGLNIDWYESSNGGFVAQKTIFSNSLKWWKINN